MLRLRNNKLSGSSNPKQSSTTASSSSPIVVIPATYTTKGATSSTGTGRLNLSSLTVSSVTPPQVKTEDQEEVESLALASLIIKKKEEEEDSTTTPAAAAATATALLRTTTKEYNTTEVRTCKTSTNSETPPADTSTAKAAPKTEEKEEDNSKSSTRNRLAALPPLSPARTLSTVTSSSSSSTSSSSTSSPRSTPPASPTQWLLIDESKDLNNEKGTDTLTPLPSPKMRISTGGTTSRMMTSPVSPSSFSHGHNNNNMNNMKGSTTPASSSSTPGSNNNITVNNNPSPSSISSDTRTGPAKTPTTNKTPAATSSVSSTAAMVTENGTKVWVKKSAVDAVKNPKMSFKEKMQQGQQQQKRKSSQSATSSSMLSSGSFSGHGSLNGSFNNGGGSFHGSSTGGFVGLGGSMSSHNRSFNRQQSSSLTRQGSFNGSISSIGGGGGGSDRDFRDLSDSQSEIGSVGGAVWGHSSAASFFNRAGGSNSKRDGNSNGIANRSSEWGWMQAYMIDSSNGSITLQLSTSDDQTQSECSFSSTGSPTIGAAAAEPVVLPSTAMSSGDIVFANEYAIDEANGSTICPDDLISLSHLHEPAVVECLQRRYDNDKIYTATGPVLLALNPFQNLRGLYSEATMKQYWDHAENRVSAKKDEDLPPHVYGMADEAFRSMMRSLEQNLGGHNGGASSDQSILVSGESGAGKTVTTKFVMKYLAALSQRAANQQLQPVERAYKKVAENKKRTGTSTGSSSSVKSFVPISTTPGSSKPSWTNKTLRTTGYSDTRDPVDSLSEQIRTVGSGGNALSNVTNLAGVGTGALNSIEAQVLQSNPILESFGNARTMRNDNSSRFGKFIEIQFTRNGRLVGAQIETYLLEKVRLVTQSTGERNYHIFYEMLSGAMPAEELRNYYIASTATADDFRMTASGTYDRRDGISDKETYRTLRTAMKTMKFSEEEQQDVFATTAALLHASNLSFCDLGDQKSALDGRNVHLEPVCHLLGVTAEDLNQALCHFSITAGKESHVQQNLDVDRAEKGLEALLKTTYGALFDFLVARINDSICFNPDDSSQVETDQDEMASPMQVSKKERPAASIGVLDIFGFESFQSNSFEQLCINYCNEALQQQFNAFVLKNEQAEYEREGIEWSFIQFPENQDVLDLIDKRGSGILCILDDQCRAPGTSDRSFALDVYNKCKNHVRFSANRKQTAVLQFCVHHYAGPVEYSTDGFVEKNRDELPKEATELLQNSLNPFIRLMAEIIENTTAEQMANNTNTPKVFRRQESNIGRATVGGQFRRQLKSLREKIDRMSPHYVRCLKPNDELVPNHFERAAVAEQLRCGGILEAVRVARAGYSNHYSHEDFLRRYRCLGRNEIKESAAAAQTRERGPTPQKKFGAAAVNAYLESKGSSTDPASLAGKKATNASAVAGCTILVKVLCKKLQQCKDDNDENEDSSNTYPTQSLSTPSSSKYHVSAAPPSWARGGSSLRGARTLGLPPAPFTSTSKSKNGASATWDKSSSDSRPPTNPDSRRSFKNFGSSSTSESAKVGIQIGKTKVFLRHKAFEALERLRSQEQNQAAVKLNSVFRMYLARVAYVHVRNAVRKSMFDLHAYENDEFKECKDQTIDDERLLEFFNRLNKMRHSYSGESFSLVEVWANQMRESLHNPRPRSEWGKIDESRPFKWMLKEGLWVKNHDFDE
mmetsp:Transcript_60054/g.147618  ORF Transcript_60054/g.147618 Transcript_60054/m.147618 type:complete len:1680 (+) Transcript_60054:347-5386(+)